jgi:hypothetical protein
MKIIVAIVVIRMKAKKGHCLVSVYLGKKSELGSASRQNPRKMDRIALITMSNFRVLLTAVIAPTTF